jgi:hypothetical protein
VALSRISILNNAISQLHEAIEKKHSKTKSGLIKFILAFFKYPGEMPQGIKHDGWKGGFTLLSSTVSTLIIGGTLTLIAIAVYYIVIAILWVILGIIILAAVFAILGAFSN